MSINNLLKFVDRFTTKKLLTQGKAYSMQIPMCAR